MIWSGYAALLALLVILGGLWLTSYAKNKAYLEEVDAKGAAAGPAEQSAAEPDPA